MTPGNTPVTNTKRANNTRKIVTSIPKYSANPAITPASVPSSGSLCNFLIFLLYQIGFIILRVLAQDDFAFAKSPSKMCAPMRPLRHSPQDLRHAPIRNWNFFVVPTRNYQAKWANALLAPAVAKALAGAVRHS